jgi:hypothetical protein
MRTLITLTSLTIIFLVGTASAAGISIEPGQWEMTSTMTMTMMPQPRTTTILDCIEEGVLNPETFNMDEDNPCDITDVTTDGNTARWLINCPTEGGPVMEGHWEVTSNGNSLTGKGEMTTEMAGQKMGFSMSWEGKRIGECEKDS